MASPVALPAPADPRLAFFVREPFPSVSTGTSVAQGLIGDGDCLEVVSEMNEGGTLFGDGIEIDRLALGWGVTARVRVAREQLRLVVLAAPQAPAIALSAFSCDFRFSRSKR